MTVRQRGPQEPATWPHQVGSIPRLARSFRHRAEGDQLRAAAQDGDTAARSQVLTGMGGVGKTQLAAEHARTAWRDASLDVLVWVTAATRTAVVSAYAKAGVELCRADPNDPEAAAATFLAWLEPKPGAAPCRWLVVLDDIADPNDLHRLWPPTAPHGQTLATTRRRDGALATYGRMVPVGLFTQAEATAYLQHALASRGCDESNEDLTALSDDLGHLPLALSQAAVYLIETGLDIPTYRTRLADRARHLADLLRAPGALLPDDQQTTVAAAWSLSLDRADQLLSDGLARPMLQFAAMLDPNGIPHDVLTSAPTLAHLTVSRSGPDAPVHEPRAVTAEEAADALGALHRLSLIDYAPDTPHQAVRVHQLIQRAQRDPLAPDEYNQIARTAADALIAAWPGVEFDIPLAQALRANTEVLAHHAEDALYEPGIHHVLFLTGNSLGKTGQASAAMNHFTRMADIALERLGPDHPDTLTARNNLSAWVGYTGDAVEAVRLFTALAADQERVRGPEHPETLITRNNLVHWRGQAGDATGAADAAADLLPFQQQVQGPEHPATLTTRNNLAAALGYAGDVAGAIAAFTELVPLRERVLGAVHPDTLTTRHNLAHWQGTAGDAAGAAAALTELLAIRTLVLGPDHPDTLTTRYDIATWRIRAGDAAGAQGYVELLPDMARVMGPDHPHTVAVWQGALGGWAGSAGEATETAAEISDFALAVLFAHRERQLDQEHSDASASRHPDRLDNSVPAPGRVRSGTRSLLHSLCRHLPRKRS